MLLLSALMLLTLNSYSQKSIYSPYTRYGIGELIDQNLGNTMGFGSIAAGIRMNDVINYANPASYSAQDTNTFIFDLGINGRSTIQRSDNNQIKRKALGFNHLAIGFPVFRWWKSSIGLVPLSQVGYHIKKTSPATDIEKAVNTFEGEGGIRQFYIGNAFNLTNNLYAGINYYYVFGNNTYQSIGSLPEDPYSGLFQKNTEYHINGSRIQLGVQYKWNLSDNRNFNFGLSYDLKSDLNMQQDNEFFSYYQFTDSQGRERKDTLDLIKDPQNSNLRYPQGLNMGFAYYTPKLIVGGDFKYQQWSTLKEFDIADSYKVMGGMQYTPDREALRSYLKRVHYRAGAYYEKSYIQINNQQLKNYGITFGLGLPLQYNRTKFNIALKLGRRGTTGHDLIEENYALIHFNITFYDFWFIKQKYR
jgi:hypothetical protein